MKNLARHTNAKNLTYTYYTWNEEKKCEVRVIITAGKDGVTELDIQNLREMDHRSNLDDRYAEENLDYATENTKCKYAAAPDDYECDPIDALGSYATSPETLLFNETVVENPQVTKLLELMQKLTPEQVDLIYAIYGEMKPQVDIAAEAGVGKAAINNRKAKILARLKRLLAEQGIS